MIDIDRSVPHSLSPTRKEETATMSRSRSLTAGLPRLVRRSGNGMALLGGCFLLAGLVACSSGPAAEADLSVTPATLASEIGKQLREQKVSIDKNSLSCPQGLDAAVGQSTNCEFTSAGQPVIAVAKVTNVDRTTVGFDITTQAQPVPKAVLAKAVRQQLSGTVRGPIDAVTCAGDLPAELGKSVKCDVTSSNETETFVVRAFTVTGGLINFTVDTH